MPKTKLFESWSFRLQLRAPFNDPSYTGAKDFGLSRYNTLANRKSTLHAPTLRAILAYAKLVHETDSGNSVEGLGAVGHQNGTFYVSEYVSASKTDCVVFNQNLGKFYSARVYQGSDNLNPYNLAPGSGNGSGTALIFCLIPILMEDDEFRENFNKLVSELAGGWTDPDAALTTALTLCDNVYRRIENARSLGSAGIKVAIPNTGNIAPITQLALDNGTYSPNGVHPLHGRRNRANGKRRDHHARRAEGQVFFVLTCAQRQGAGHGASASGLVHRSARGHSCM